MRKMLMTMLAGFIGSMALAAEFFVDAKNGNDANGGTEQLPVRSLARAAELATGSSDGTVTVTVLPGFYGEDEGTDLSMIYTSASGAQANYRVVLATGNTKTVTFKARDGKAVTHIVGKKSVAVTNKDGRGDDAVAGVRNDKEAYAIFDGFTFRDCYGPMTATDQIDRGGASRDVTLVDCVISNCCASIGSAAYGGVLHRCRVTANKAVSSTSSIVQAADLSNCLLDSNAGTTLTYCKLIVNCTIYGNTLGQPFGGVSGSTEVYNTLAFGNAKSNGHGSESEKYPYEFINSVAVAPALFPTVTDSITNAVGDQCVSASLGDWRLLPSSPAVGIGTVEGLKKVGLPTGYTEYRDYNGNLIDVSDSTARINAGCVQTVTDAPAGATMAFDTAFEVEGLGTVPAGGSFAPMKRQYRVRPVLAEGKSAYAIKVAEETSGKFDYLRHALMDGWTPVVPNPDVSATMTFSVVEAKAVYYVDPAGDDGNDGSSPTSGAGNVGPKKTISGALAVAPHYSIIRVARGVYGADEESGELLSRVKISNNVGLISSDGIGAAKIIGASDNGTFGPAAKRCVHITSTYGFVQGFVLADGYSDDVNDDAYRGAGVSAASVNPQILDCTITNCHAIQAGALYRGTALRTRIYGCSASGSLLTYVTTLGSCVLADNSPTTKDKWVGDKGSAFACTLDFPSDIALPYSSSAFAFVGNIVRGGGRLSTDPENVVANVMDEDPLFRDATAYDFRLGAGSPAVGLVPAEALSISNAYRYVTTDLNGDPLVFTDGKMTAGAVHNDPLLPIVIILVGDGGIAVTGAAIGTNVVETSAEITITATETATRPFLGFEVNGVMRPASETEISLSGFGGGTRTSVRAFYGTTWYVSKTGDDSRSGGTPETAKKTIRAAATLAVAGDTIKVGPGAYGEEDGTMRQTAPVVKEVADIDCRVWVKEGVTLESTDGPERTFIVGRRATEPQDDYGNGAGAVRCVVLGRNAMVKGFTLTGGATGYDGVMDKVVYTDHNCAGGVLGTSSANSQVVDCIVSNNVATTSAAGYNVRFVRSRILENTVVQRAITRNCRFAGSVIDRNRGDICIEYFGEFDSSTIGPNNLKLNGGIKPSMLQYPSDTPTLRNSVVLAPQVGIQTYFKNSYTCNITNCIFVTGCGLTHETMQQYGLGDDFDLVDVAAIGVDGELRPIAGSASVLLDRGDDFSCDDVKAAWDASGAQRVMNGGRDIGALEGDWRGVYAQDIGRRVKVVAVRPDVYEDVADGKVTIPSGEGLQLELSNPASGEATCELTLQVLSGTLALALDGTDLDPVAASDEPVTVKLVLSPGAHALSLTMSSAPGDLAKVIGYRRNVGMCVIVR